MSDAVGFEARQFALVRNVVVGAPDTSRTEITGGEELPPAGVCGTTHRGPHALNLLFSRNMLVYRCSIHWGEEAKNVNIWFYNFRG